MAVSTIGSIAPFSIPAAFATALGAKLTFDIDRQARMRTHKSSAFRTGSLNVRFGSESDLVAVAGNAAMGQKEALKIRSGWI